ncbi:hypothetical protein [Bacillus subtilis]|uniref:hypothetical protein n=1 Tax=Bacillus subtilis TaxID=1423 RepID=UPI0016431BF9|nr:hypothetical protein [Bacillus subtilis]
MKDEMKGVKKVGVEREGNVEGMGELKGDLIIGKKVGEGLSSERREVMGYEGK